MVGKKVIAHLVKWGTGWLERHYAKLDRRGYKSLKDSTKQPETKKEKVEVQRYVSNYNTIKKMVCDLNNKNCKFIDK